MAKILNFRNKGSAPTGDDFLTDGNHTLSFRKTEDGGISLDGICESALSDLFPDPKKDWTNQELADLFRVRQLLGAANVPVETDRGVTDEGDPWFVFCHATGDVFIHLCRIDGAYVLDSPNVQRPLRGANFNELIADFTNQALPAQTAPDEAERRVIRLDRGGKVQLHPSAMLAALIWTLFLASEELVMLAPEETEGDSDTLLDFEGLVPLAFTESADIDLHVEDDSIDLPAPEKEADNHPETDIPESHTQMRDTQQHGLTVQNNAFTMGLSTIAIAMGFMSETVLLNNQRKVLDGLADLGLSDSGDATQDVADLTLPDTVEGGALIAMLAEFLGLERTFNTDMAEVRDATASEAQKDLTHLTDAALTDMVETDISSAKPAVEIRDKKFEPDQTAEATARAKSASETADGAVQMTAKEASANDVTQKDASLTLSEIIQTWQPLMEEFKLGHTTVRASFDVNEIDDVVLFDVIDTTTEERSTNVREFDAQALRLIEFLEAKDGEVGFIELADEVIMIDRTAYTGGDTGYVQWEASDGRTISFIGLTADFEQFDMIA